MKSVDEYQFFLSSKSAQDFIGSVLGQIAQVLAEFDSCRMRQAFPNVKFGNGEAQAYIFGLTELQIIGEIEIPGRTTESNRLLVRGPRFDDRKQVLKEALAEGSFRSTTA